MDLYNEFKSLVLESLACKSFKELHLVKRLLCVIILAPFIALYTGILLIYWALAIVYRCAQGILEYVHAFVKNERENVRHGTEIVIYLIAFPTIFAMKLANTVFSIILMVVHAVASLVGYIATFGGIKFSPFIYTPAARSSSKVFAEHCKAAVTVFVVLGIVLLSLSLCFKVVTYEIYKIYRDISIRIVLVSEMERAKDQKLITTAAWNRFADEYNTYGVTVENYREYEAKYLRGIEHKSWDTEKEVEFVQLVETAYNFLQITYVMFTILFVAIYSNVIKRRALCNVEALCEPWDKSTRLEWNRA